jgi:hypothetical protein
MTIGFLHIPKTAGLYLTQRINVALDLPDITIHKVLNFEEISVQSLGEVQNEIGNQFLIMGHSGYNDEVISSYPFYGGHLSKFDLIRLNRSFRFTTFIDPWKRAFSLFSYSLNHSLTPERNLDEQFENWLVNNFKGSIFRQFYGVKLCESHDFSDIGFNEEFVAFFDAIYLCEPNEVISSLQAQENLGLKALTNGPKVNESAGVNHFKFFKSSTDRLYDIFCESLQPEIELIDAVKSVSKNDESTLKNMYTRSEFENLYDHYRSR